MADLARCLQEAQGARHRMIATDGVFSMDGTYAPLDEICDLAARYDALVMVDDCHATGFELLPGEHAIIPVMLRDAKLAQDMAARLSQRGVFVTAFSFPVVPKGQDRIRTQMSAGLMRDMLDRAIDAFEGVGRKLGVVL